MFDQMWSIRLMCLLFLNQWYKAFNLYRIRKFIYRVSIRYCTVAIWTFMFLEFGLCSAQPNPNDPKINNFHVQPFVKNDHIYLNMSWEISKLPVNYRVLIKPENKDDHCSDASAILHIITNTTDPYFLIETNRGVQRDCMYDINIQYTINKTINNYVRTYTVPDCIDNKCSCKQIHILRTPEVKFRTVGSNYELLLFIYADQAWFGVNNLSEVIFVFINIDPGVSEKEFKWNITNEDANRERVFRVDVNELFMNSSYTLSVNVYNSKGCVIAGVSDYSIRTLSPKQHWFLKIILPIILIVLFIVVFLIFMKRKECCCYLCKLLMLNKLCPPQTHIRPICRPAVTETRGQSYLPVPMEFNNLYIEQEILDEISRGNADKYEVSHSRLRIERKIGGGAFGQVFLAMAVAIPGMPEYSPVAVKTLNKSASSEECEEFKKEIEMLKQIGYHRNIVKLLGCCTLKQPYSMIMEYIPHGDLLKYLRTLRSRYEKRNTFQFTLNQTSNSDPSNKASESSYVLPPGLPSNRLPSITETEYTTLSSEGIPLTPCTPQQTTPSILNNDLDPKELQNFALQIAQGMEYLESLQIVHRDLAARNVLIDENKTLKISDFGLSRRGVYVNMKHNTVPLRWLSIEAIRENVYTNKSDVWAYAIVLWEIGTLGGFPYPTIDNSGILEFLRQGKRLEKPENCTEELYKLMRQCWECSLEQRPTFKEVVQYLEDISNRKRVYVDFSQMNPSYMYPPIEEQSVTVIKPVRTIEIILPDT